MEVTARDENPEPLDVASNVPERARRFEEELATSPGEVVLQRMLTDMDSWFRKVVAGIARKWRLDPDDVYQQAALRLRTSRTIDPEHRHVLGYIRKCIQTAAHDLDVSRRKSPPLGPNEDVALAAWWGIGRETDTERSAFDDPPFIDDEWLEDVLDRASIDGHRRDVLMYLVRYGDMPLVELAAALRRSYAATRQDKHRALAGLRSAFELTDDEHSVYRAWHQGLSPGEICREIGISPTAVDDLLAAARRKIMQFLYPERGVDR